MTKTIIEQILYGQFRPWHTGSAEKLKAYLKKEPGKTGDAEDGPLEWWSAVDLPQPFNAETLMYRRAIKRHVRRLHSRIVWEIEEQERELDKRYLFKKAVRNLKDVIEDARRLHEKWASEQSTAEEKPKVETIHFVLNDICLQFMNVLLDLGLRYSDMHPEYAYTVDQMYPELLDEPPPESPPFGKTTEWYRQEIEKELKVLAEAPSADITGQSSSIIQLLQDLGLQISRNAEAYDSLKIQQLLHQVENALFLKYMDASFLKKNPEKLADERYCREWVNGMKQELMNGEYPNGSVTTMQQLHEAFVWLEDCLSPLDTYHSRYTRSVARRWGMQFRRATAEPARAGKTDTPGKSPEPDTDFVQYFQQHFIHRQELQQALGVGKKTVDSYLEGSSVRALTLNANVWYRRSDVEHFLEENME